MSKKKIGIITLNGYFNFGNRLQNYALTKVLESKGFDVITLWDKSLKTILKDKIKSILFFSKKYRRFIRFYRFSKKNMIEKRVGNNNLSNFDYFVIGSDQVWNYKLMDKDKTWFYPKEDKIAISYAASLGTSNMPKEFKEKFYNMIKLYQAISVREKSAEKVIRSLGYEQEVLTVVDPTMLIGKEEWYKCIKKTKYKVPVKYIFMYFLGDISKDYKDEIYSFAKKNNCDVINILDINSKYYDIGPQEFLYLINNAFLICTDSFHACVFSFKFDKPFVVFKRTGEGISNDMYTRLDNLLTTFNLQNREYNGINITHDNIKSDYSEGHLILEKEIDKSNKFLDRYLKI